LSCVLTLLTTTTNLAVLVGLHGEPAWIFLLCCNLDAVFSVLIRRWVTLKGPSTTITSRSPDEIRVDESNAAAAPTFSSSETAQNVDIERNQHELVLDQNGKVTQIRVERAPSDAGDKDSEIGVSSTHVEHLPTIQTPPNLLITEEAAFSDEEFCDGEVEGVDEEREDSDVESLGRAIITTHISAQKMDNSIVDKFSRNDSPEDFLYGVDAKLGGIRVMIEQVVEVEYESDLGP
jgi:hypothetical protein